MGDRWTLLGADAIDFYFEFNRFGPNFHPPLASYGHLVTWFSLHRWMDDLSARRVASSLELGMTAAITCAFLARRFGPAVGLFAGLGLGSLPRVFGDSHVAGTDIPLMTFWTLSALLFPSALVRRERQVWFACSMGLLFLVKFSGLVIVVPIALAYTAYLLSGDRYRYLLRWLGWSIFIVAPLAPVALTLLAGNDPNPWGLFSVAPAIRSQSGIWSLAFFWPATVLLFRRWIRTNEPMPIGMELPWRTIAYAPLIAIGLNPTWWHDPIGSLASFFDLSLRRQGYLPDIEIFYLGQQYVYSLPWHNSWVLMGVTIPVGMLILGVVGSVGAMATLQPISVYLLLQAITLPVARMFPIPAHDGVRLFLPTFPFWSALAAMGAWGLVRWLGSNNSRPRWAWVILFLIGPVWGWVEIIRWHPYELSYYNIGLKRAQQAGFEVTYWYDAVTGPVLDDLNRELPEGAYLSLPSPRINPEVFFEHQSQGRLRPDLRFDLSTADDFPHMLLLTHASKADPFTRLLFGVRPWYQSSKDGVRLFSVIDPEGVALAWSLHFLAVGRDENHRPVVNERSFAAPTDSLEKAWTLLTKHGRDAIRQAEDEPQEVQDFLNDWLPRGEIHPDLARLLPTRSTSFEQAIHLLRKRPKDIRILIETPGYPTEESFHGYLRYSGDSAGRP
jgi:hypothetical protein